MESTGRDIYDHVVTEWCTNCGGYTGPTTEYISLAGSFVAEYKNDTTYFVHPDHLGSTRLLTDLNQNVVQNVDYLPFGELNSGNSGYTSHMFTGDERDAETDLDHTWFRQYSNPQSWNRYAYVLDDPLALIDPFGLDSCVLLNNNGGATVIDTSAVNCASDRTGQTARFRKDSSPHRLTKLANSRQPLLSTPLPRLTLE